MEVTQSPFILFPIGYLVHTSSLSLTQHSLVKDWETRKYFDTWEVYEIVFMFIAILVYLVGFCATAFFLATYPSPTSLPLSSSLLMLIVLASSCETSVLPSTNERVSPKWPSVFSVVSYSVLPSPLIPTAS